MNNSDSDRRLERSFENGQEGYIPSSHVAVVENIQAQV